MCEFIVETVVTLVSVIVLHMLGDMIYGFEMTCIGNLTCYIVYLGNNLRREKGVDLMPV